MKYLTLTLLFVSAFSAFANASLPDNRHIAVTGMAELSAKPDIATVSLAVESLQSESLAAKRNVDTRVNQFLDGLHNYNIDEENVSGSSISIEPHYVYIHNKQQLDGYRAYRHLKVTLNNIKQLNTLMDFALKVKINKIRNIDFSSSKADVLKDEVNALAVKNAKEKGRSLAKAFDAELGNIYSINSTSNQSRHRYGANNDIEAIQFSSARMNKPARPGKYLQENIVFTSTINVVFDLHVE